MPGFSDEENVIAIRSLVATGKDVTKTATGIMGNERDAGAESGERNLERNDNGVPGEGRRGPKGDIGQGRADPAASVAPELAALMWRAAHFYQADRLKAKCEDSIMAGLRQVAAAANYGATEPSSNGHYTHAQKQQQQQHVAQLADGQTSYHVPPQRLHIPGDPPRPPATSLTACLSEILELGDGFSGGDASARLLHLVAAWLMEHTCRLIGNREVRKKERPDSPACLYFGGSWIFCTYLMFVSSFILASWYRLLIFWDPLLIE